MIILGVQRVPTSELKARNPARDTLVFDQSNAAYKQVGLVSHPGKQRRFETQGTLLGADFDGLKGSVCAPRPRIMLLSWVSALVCKKGTCTRQFAGFFSWLLDSCSALQTPPSFIDGCFV